ncbi:hypothetical protein J8L04_19315, partial [Bacteroides fragilis]|uniref:hypothetical protein n=1 Tax=Bacteroides fragilis TaxID=817 RepID=UPI00202F87AB
EQSNPRCLQEEEGDNHLTPFSINLKAKIRIYNFTPQSYSLILLIQVIFYKKTTGKLVKK